MPVPVSNHSGVTAVRVDGGKILKCRNCVYKLQLQSDQHHQHKQCTPAVNRPNALLPSSVNALQADSTHGSQAINFTILLSVKANSFSYFLLAKFHAA